MTTPSNAAFARFLDAADPYLPHIVIAGGWASRLHRLCPRATAPDFMPLSRARLIRLAEPPVRVCRYGEEILS